MPVPYRKPDTAEKDHMRSLDTDVKRIIKHIAQGDNDAAQETFKIAMRHGAEAGALARALGKATPASRGTIIVGPSLLVYANPFRVEGYSWRCGSCPWTANNYKTRRGAEKSANEHAGEHPGIKVRWITRPNVGENA